MSQTDQDSERLKGLIYALLATIGWAFTGVLIRLLDVQSSDLIIFGRLVVSTIILFPLIIREKEALMLAFKTPLSLLMALYYIFATEAFVRSTIVEVVLIVGLTPLVVMVIGLFYGERVSRMSAIGALVTIFGLVTFLLPSFGEIGAQRVSGNMLAFAAAIASAIFAFGLRKRTLENRPIKVLPLTFVTFCYGIMLSGLLLLFNGTAFPESYSVHNISVLVGLGIISTVMPTLLFGIAATKLPSVITSSLTLLTPIWAALIGGVIISEWPEPLSVPGALVTLVGLWVIIRKK